MPKFTFTSPDGRKVTVTGPEGATVDEAFKMAESQMNAPAGASAAQQSSAPVPAAGGPATDLAGPTLQFGPWDTHVPIPEVVGSNLTRAGKAVADAGDKMKLLYLLATKGSDAPETQAHTAQVTAEDATYDASRAAQQAAANKKFGRAPDDSGWSAIPQALSNPAAMAYLLEGGGPDVTRFASNVALTAPLMAAVPARAAATVTGRLLTGSGLGGATSLFTTPNHEGTALSVAKDAGISAAAGGVLQGGAELGSKVITSVAAKVAQLAKAISARLGGSATADKVAAEVAAKVPEFDTLPAFTQATVIDKARDAMRSGKAYDADALTRQADAKSLGINTTRGQDTRDPSQWYAEQELSKRQDPATGGPALNQQLIDVNAQLRDQVPQLRAGVRSTATTPYEAAESAREGVQGFAKSTQANVREKYDAAATAPGSEQPIDGKAFFDRIDPLLQDFEDAIPGAVKTRLEQLRAGLGGPSKAQKARAPLSVDPQTDSISMATRKLGGINPDDDAVGSIAKSILFAPDPRNGGVWRKPTFGQNGRTLTGHSPDEMAGKLAQHGYGERNQLREDLLDKLADESNGAGGMHFSDYREPPSEDPLANAIGDLVKQMAIKNNPAAQAAPRDFTVAEAAKLRKLIVDRMSEGGSTGKAGGALKAALDEIAGGTGGEAGAAANLYGEAVSSARQRFQQLEPTPIAALNDVKEAAPNYLQTKILAGKPKELAALRDMLQSSKPGAWDDIRGQVMEHLQYKGTNGNPEGQWSGMAFKKALDAIGMDRLKVLFTPGELSQLGTISRVGVNTQVAPPRAHVNQSNTASSLQNLLDANPKPGMVGSALTHVPVVGPTLVGGYVKGKELMANQALKAAGADALNPSHTAPPLDGKAMRELLAKLLLRVGAPAAGMAAGQRSTSGP